MFTMVKNSKGVKITNAHAHRIFAEKFPHAPEFVPQSATNRARAILANGSSSSSSSSTGEQRCMVRDASMVGHLTFDMYIHELVSWDILMQHERFRVYDSSGVCSGVKLCCAAPRPPNPLSRERELATHISMFIPTSQERACGSFSFSLFSLASLFLSRVSRARLRYLRSSAREFIYRQARDATATCSC